jgi:16S rRNA C1402 (ribose-2'-O) methylase RsmI
VPAASVAVAREITKRHEETLVGSPAAVAERLGQPRGEFTVVVSAISQAPRAGADAAALLAAARQHDLAERATIDLLRAAGVPRREAYRLVHDKTD